LISKLPDTGLLIVAEVAPAVSPGDKVTSSKGTNADSAANDGGTPTSNCMNIDMIIKIEIFRRTVFTILFTPSNLFIIPLPFCHSQIYCIQTRTGELFLPHAALFIRKFFYSIII